MPKTTLSLLILSLATLAPAAEIVEVTPITDRWVMVHFDEGRVVYHGAGQTHNDDQVIIAPLDVQKARDSSTYRLTSKGLPGARVGPVCQKSKGTEFAWYVDRWVNGAAVNDRPDHTKEHWFFLSVQPLIPGNTYVLDTGNLASNGNRWTFTFDPNRHRSEAVHVNTVGYSTAAPQKFGYVYAWMGNGGPLDLATYVGREFRVVDAATGAVRLRGKLALRKSKETTETAWVNEAPPHGNFQGADVYECDFSSLNTPGSYRLAVDGIGSSYPFTIGANPYRDVFFNVARTLYHNRSGIELKAPFTEFTRPAPHNPLLTPGICRKAEVRLQKVHRMGERRRRSGHP